MKLSAPTKIIFWIAVIAALIGFIVALGVFKFLSASVGTIIVFAAFVLLSVACIIKGL